MSHTFIRHDLEQEKPKKARDVSARAEGAIARKRLEEKRVDEQLTHIYGSERGQHMRLERPHAGTARAIIFLFLSFVILGATAWVGFFYLQPREQFSDAAIALSISGEPHAIVGSLMSYRIHYANTERVPLHDAVIEIRYPSAFVFVTSSKSARNAGNDEWDIGTVASGATGDITITGRMEGDIGATQSFRVFFDYTPENFRSAFQKVATLSLDIASSPVDATLDVRPEIIAGNDTNIVIRLTAASGTTIGNIEATFSGGNFFTRKSVDVPDLSDNPNTWRIENFSGEKVITILGAFTPQHGENLADASLVVRGWPEKRRVGSGYILASVRKTISLARADASVHLAINGTVSDFSVTQGDVLLASVAVKNQGQTAMKNVVVRAVFDTPSFDHQSLLKWSALEDASLGKLTGEQLNDVTRRGAIVWNADAIPALEKLAPGQEVDIDLRVPIKNKDDVDLSKFATADVNVSAAASYDAPDGTRAIVSSNAIRASLASDTTFGVSDTVSRGGIDKPLHTILWSIENALHPLKTIRVEGDIYGDVSLSSSSTDRGSVSYDPQTKHLVWTVGEMPTSTQKISLQSAFLLNTVNPTQTNLSSAVNFSAIDAVTGVSIVKAGEAIRL